jgi:hypothetical protein
MEENIYKTFISREQNKNAATWQMLCHVYKHTALQCEVNTCLHENARVTFRNHRVSDTGL